MLNNSIYVGNPNLSSVIITGIFIRKIQRSTYSYTRFIIRYMVNSFGRISWLNDLVEVAFER